MAKVIKASEIALIINNCLDGVERSNVGSIYIKDEQGEPKTDSHGVRIVSTFGMSVFLHILNHQLQNLRLKQLRELGSGDD